LGGREWFICSFPSCSFAVEQKREMAGTAEEMKGAEERTSGEKRGRDEAMEEWAVEWMWGLVQAKRVRVEAEEKRLRDSAAAERLRGKMGGQLLEELAKLGGKKTGVEKGAMRAWAEARGAAVEAEGKYAGAVGETEPTAEVMLTITWEEGEKAMEVRAEYNYSPGISSLNLEVFATGVRVCDYNADTSVPLSPQEVRDKAACLGAETAEFVVDLVCGVPLTLHPADLEKLRGAFWPCIKRAKLMQF